MYNYTITSYKVSVKCRSKAGQMRFKSVSGGIWKRNGIVKARHVWYSMYDDMTLDCSNSEDQP